MVTYTRDNILKKGGVNRCRGDDVGADSQPKLSEDYAATIATITRL
jgi:hypothetical protein